METFDLGSVPGVSECRLDEATLADLPPNEAPAPWDCELSAVVWWGRGGQPARRAAGPGAPAGSHAVAVVGGLVSYDRTPVGKYHEVYGAIGLRTGRSVRGTIPFMSVDSRASLVGGRSNWSLPKCLADFDGEPGAGTMTARGSGWTVRAHVRAFGPHYPLPMTGRIVQPWPDGVLRESVLEGKARARTAIVTVEVESEGDLASWLRPGRHLGAVLTQTRFCLSAAR
jgi:Acetoacetate decarboxylase (ADC)